MVTVPQAWAGWTITIVVGDVTEKATSVSPTCRVCDTREVVTDRGDGPTAFIQCLKDSKRFASDQVWAIRYDLDSPLMQRLGRGPR